MEMPIRKCVPLGYNIGACLESGAQSLHEEAQEACPQLPLAWFGTEGGCGAHLLLHYNSLMCLLRNVGPLCFNISACWSQGTDKLPLLTMCCIFFPYKIQNIALFCGCVCLCAQSWVLNPWSSSSFSWGLNHQDWLHTIASKKLLQRKNWFEI